MLSIMNDTAIRFYVMLKTDRKAAGALEYALLVSLIAVAVVTGVTAFGSKLGTFFLDVGNSIGTLASTV